MLLWLSIRDFVLIEKLDIEFGEGFTVLTGETGAGKSILLDAIGLLLGDRFDKRQLREGADKTDLSAGFHVDERSVTHAWLSDHDFLDDDDPAALVIRRTQDAQNKSRSWINGRAATLSQLSALSETLIELHGQHEHQSLSRANMQRDWLDAFAKTTELVKEVGEAWRVLKDAKHLLETSVQNHARLATERAFIEDRLNELSALSPQEGEWEALNTKHQQLSHADALIAAAEEACQILSDADDAIEPFLSKLAQKLQHEGNVEPLFHALGDRIDAAAIELSDIAHELRDYARKFERDPHTLEQITARMTAFFDAARKYRVPPETLPALFVETQAALHALSKDTDIEALQEAVTRAGKAYFAQAETLSRARKTAALKLNREVTASMRVLSMEGGRFEARVTSLPEDRAESHGVDRVEFCLAAHPAQPIAPLAEVASGGELSRISLALLTVLAQTANVPTMIFDEIDTGVGGATGHAIGQKLRDLGESRQVLCVTHLPQVAACARAHYQVTKKGDARHVNTQVLPLDENQRIEELARMLGGATLTKTTRAHAKEMLAEGKAFVFGKK
ncbi:MAG: DNA repair protein RecN [Burkholderiales bacterium]|jgi:DNA repair protein RecN (Recombination protein N)|nr:DNA repair protein RecN [Burkholderiales bacterium]